MMKTDSCLVLYSEAFVNGTQDRKLCVQISKPKRRFQTCQEETKGSTPTNRSVRRNTSPKVTRMRAFPRRDRKSTRLNSSHLVISYAVFCLKKKKIHYLKATVDPAGNRPADSLHAPRAVLPLDRLAMQIPAYTYHRPDTLTRPHDHPLGTAH